MAFEFEYKATFVSPKGAMIKGPKIKLEKKKRKKKKIYAHWLFPVIMFKNFFFFKYGGITALAKNIKS